MTEAEELASHMSKMDYDLLWEYPLQAGRTWKTPARFYQYGIVTARKRWKLWGDYSDHLTSLGIEVRNILQQRFGGE